MAGRLMTAPTRTPVAGPVDSATAADLALIDADPLHASDRATVVAAVRRTASEHGGLVDPNALRVLLANEHGSTVTPGCIGATICALKRAGVLRFAGWVETTGSRTRNNGKQARAYWADLALLESP